MQYHTYPNRSRSSYTTQKVIDGSADFKNLHVVFPDPQDTLPQKTAPRTEFT